MNDLLELLPALREHPAEVLVLVLAAANVAQWRAAAKRRAEIDKLVREMFRMTASGSTVDDDTTAILRRHDQRRAKR